MCSSFKAASTDLCSALVAVNRRISTSSIHPEGLSAFVICRLIPLDKSVSPIGIGEVSRRSISQALLEIIKVDIEKSAGPLQVCAGHNGGLKMLCIL